MAVADIAEKMTSRMKVLSGEKMKSVNLESLELLHGLYSVEDSLYK